MSQPVYTALQGQNAQLIAQVARLYLRPGMKVADVTYGQGAFWREMSLDGIEFFPSDLATGVDFRELPYPDQWLDVVVLDPPYMHNPGHPQVDGRYQNSATTRGMGHQQILHLYEGGILEAYRVLKGGGTLWLKCQDEIESGRQRWSHIELHDRAVQYGFRTQDFFVLMRPAAALQAKRQLHARKNHSYLWIFQKP